MSSVLLISGMFKNKRPRTHNLYIYHTKFPKREGAFAISNNTKGVHFIRVPVKASVNISFTRKEKHFRMNVDVNLYLMRYKRLRKKIP